MSNAADADALRELIRVALLRAVQSSGHPESTPALAILVPAATPLAKPAQPPIRSSDIMAIPIRPAQPPVRTSDVLVRCCCRQCAANRAVPVRPASTGEYSGRSERAPALKDAEREDGSWLAALAFLTAISLFIIGAVTWNGEAFAGAAVALGTAGIAGLARWASLTPEQRAAERERRHARAVSFDTALAIEAPRKRISPPPELRRQVWAKSGGRCQHCRCTDDEAMTRTGKHLEYDHIKPWSKGGADTLENLQLLCNRCNRKKSNRYTG
jgi:HNH endonuclease